MKKPDSLLSKIATVLIGVGIIAAFIFAMEAVQKKVAVEAERKQLEIRNQNQVYQKQAQIVITEVMTSNSLTIQDGFGSSSDWIEFYNSGDAVINLKGAGLSTNIDDPMMWVFPNFEVGPHEYRIVFASGLNEKDSAGILHTNFKLNARVGETLVFTSALGTLLSQIDLPPLDRDISYGVNEAGVWGFFNHPTPNQANGADGQDSPDFKTFIESPLKITEYMTDNRSVLYDEDGDYVDWVEFYNDSDEPFSLARLFFTDDMTDLRKWAFPEVVIAPRSYLVVYASGKDKVTENIHTNFKISAHETLMVSTQYSEVLVELTLDPLVEDISQGMQNGAWLFFSEPTPGSENNSHGFTEILKPTSKDWDVVINEVMASNESFLADPAGNYADWIELKNNTDREINLKGYSLSKGAQQEVKFVFPDYLLPANGFAVFFADATITENGTGNYVPFSISASGETLSLCAADCDEPQRFESGALGKNLSSGLNDSGERVFFENPTPNEPNSPLFAQRVTQPVQFSLNVSEISGGQSLSLSARAGAQIFYTLDGSLPTTSDTLYSGPLVINASETVRAIAVAEGELPSVVTTHTYVVDVEHDLPIIAISTNPENMFGTDGIYDNPFEDVEIPVHIEFYETDDLPALSFDAGLKIFGGFSRPDPQKSLAVHLRKKYGTEAINYPLFENNEVTTFKHFILHTSGQDSNRTKIRDAFVHRAVKTVIDVDAMDGRPCVVYINGEYWGLYFIREKVNEDYFASYYGVDPVNVDFLEWNGYTKAGSNQDYLALIQYVATHDMKNPEYYDYVASQVDIDNLIDYLIIESFFGNTDSGNIKYWRDREGGKWRWVLYDMDWALFPSTYQWNNLAQIFNPGGMGFGDWIITTLHVNLMQNDQFKNEFIRRYALYTNTYFSPERLLPIFDDMIAEIRSEMPRHLERWPRKPVYGLWENEVARMRQIIIDKPAIEKQNLRFFFSLNDQTMQQLFPEDQ